MAQINHQTLKDLAADQRVYQTLVDNNVNLVSGLATNYLNHYIEILLLLEILPDMPDCFEDIRNWKPMSYPAHVRQSGLPNNEIVLKAYEIVDKNRREQLAMVAQEADRGLEGLIMRAGTAVDKNDPELLHTVASQAKEFLSPLIERMTGLITPSALSTKPFIEFAV